MINNNLFFRANGQEVLLPNGQKKVTLKNLPLTEITPVNIHLFVLNK
jgi:hypothetical protein